VTTHAFAKNSFVAQFTTSHFKREPHMRTIENIPVVTDSGYEPKAAYNALDRFLLRLINDPRDLPFMHFVIEASVVIVPLAFALYFSAVPWIVAALYLPLNILFYMDRFILMLHNTSHRPLFRKKYRGLTYYIVWILGPLFGESPETYFAHHMGMHHVEENLEEDLSSTMTYQRDSFASWLRYSVRFFFGSDINLIIYLAKKGRRKLLSRVISGEVAYALLVAVACIINWQATIVVFIVPFIACRIAMIAGNWGQHAFIDAARPDDPFASSITVINCRYNQRCFNDGYHIGHHRKSTLHWTELPAELRTNMDLYMNRGAIVFAGIDFITVWVFLMLKRYDLLAARFVELQNPARSTEEVIALLKNRTQAIRAASK